MPILHEADEYIYEAIKNAEQNKPGPNHNWNPTEKVYKYSNTLFPNKSYKKIFNPKSFMIRGDVIHFGEDDYRNNNKMIFNGEKLEHLYSEVDDYGSIPPSFVVGDGEDEFDIGDFEDVINHNSINWLSKDKLKEIIIFTNENNNIEGNVNIRDKEWRIFIEIYHESEFKAGWWGSKNYKCNIEDCCIYINKLEEMPIHNKKYIIKPLYNLDENNLLKLVETNNNLLFINYYVKSTTSSYLAINRWFIFKSIKEYKLSSSDNILNFPIIWKKVTNTYISETLLLSQETYNKYMNNNVKELDNVYIKEIIGYPVTIELLNKENDILMGQIKDYINKLIDNYDDVNKRHPFHQENNNSVSMYF